MPGEERRKQLIEVAIDLFSRRGFSGTTTREIAAAAGVTEAVIFRHFATKQDLYAAILDYKSSASKEAGFSEVERLMAAGDDEGLFRFILTNIIADHRRDPRFERLMTHAALEGHEIAVMHHRKMTDAIGARITRYIEDRQRAGFIRASQPLAVLFAVVGTAYFYANRKYIHQICSTPELSDEQMIDSFVAILMHGLTDKPRGNQH